MIENKGFGTRANCDSANVFAEELFQAAFAEGHDSREAWERFRVGVLEHAAGRDECEIMEGFLGRPANADALLRSLGIGRGV